MKEDDNCLCSCFAAKDDETDPDSKSSICKLEKKFVESTSCHGISYWCSSTNHFQRVLWILLVLGATAGLVQQVYTRVNNYFLYAASTEVSRQFVNEIDFPAVTICNYNRFFALNMSNTTEVAGFHVLNRITTPLLMTYFELAGIPTDLSVLDQFTNTPNFTISGYMSEKGYQLNPASLIECRFGSSRCSAADFTPVITKMGKCFTFNANTSNHLKQATPGFGKGLSLFLHARHIEYTEEPVYGNQEAGIMFQVHSKHEAPNVDLYGIGVPVGHKAFAVVSRKDSQIMESPWGQCFPENEKTLKYFSIYSLHSCMLECYTDLLIAECNCRTFDQHWAADHAPECTPWQVVNCSTPFDQRTGESITPNFCQCTIPCSSTEYTTIPSYATAPSQPTRRYIETVYGFPPELRVVEENGLLIDVTFSEIGYSKETQTKKVDEGSLISDVGGQLGLWIGMSFLTLAEFFQYFATRIWKSGKWSYKKIIKSKMNSKVDDIATKNAWNENLQNGHVHVVDI